jgi:hypothetical protein
LTTVPDQKPPRSSGDERETLMVLLQFQRESVVRKVEGVSDADARTSPVASGTSLLWLVRHLAMAEHRWVVNRFAGRPDREPADAVADGDTLADAVELYRSTSRVVDAIVAGAGLDDRCRALDAGDPPTNLRWVLGHLLEETARHAGHADIIRELLDGDTGR